MYHGEVMLKVPTVNLGNTGLKISELGFGTVYFGIASFKISPEEGSQILINAHRLGINYWDTSDDYGSHPHVSAALKSIPRKEVIISTKTRIQSAEKIRKSVEKCLEELNTDYIDIFMLHEVEYRQMEECYRALKELDNIKSTETIKALGLSTHSVAVVREVAQFEEVNLIMSICCKTNQSMVNRFRERIPLEDGSIEEMFSVLRLAHDEGKGIVAMKVLGCGALPLIRSYRKNIKAVSQLDFVDAMVIGMHNLEEAKKNAKAITHAVRHNTCQDLLMKQKNYIENLAS
jgi:aryl-alcohol dehydrogenase-like predicted oxidoreductase